VLRIATLNCLNLAAPGRVVYEGMPPYTPDEYIAKTQWLATMLDRLAADFVLVQEVFDKSALSDVVRQTASRGRGLSLAVPFADSKNTRPRLGLIWRTPWAPQIDSIVDLPPGWSVTLPEKGEHKSFSRAPLRARIELPDGRALMLINVHLKSRRPEFADGDDRDDPAVEARAQLRSLIMRGAEAAALRRIIVEATRGNRMPLVVAGDFNAEPGAVTTQIVADTSWKPDDRPQRDCMLFDALEVETRLSPGRSRDVAFTILHAGEPERIDHVLVSEEFVPQSKHAIGRVLAVEILNDHLAERRRGLRLGAPANGGTPDLARIYSDHAAVCVTLAFDSAAPAVGAQNR
jgi:endonuclease/exonuclease/phosphatase family metal-dependent hydrolase